MVEEFKENVDFLIIYIDEAHPTDGWTAGMSEFHIAQHATIQDRIEAAKVFVKKMDIKCDVFTDLISNDATNAYGALYDRLYVVQSGVIYYQGGMGPENYNIKELRSKLIKLTATQ